jgi:ArsR family transcriptional regulator
MERQMYYLVMAPPAKVFDMERLFRALADRTRLRLLNLMAGQEICVCYLVEITGEGQPKISRHLAYLRRVGVVAAKREGKWMHYQIEQPKDAAGRRVLDAVLAWLREDKAMQADRARLTRACCKPGKYVAAQGAPVPTPVSNSIHKECR